MTVILFTEKLHIPQTVISTQSTDLIICPLSIEKQNQFPWTASQCLVLDSVPTNGVGGTLCELWEITCTFLA